jgi:VanZ family protein
MGATAAAALLFSTSLEFAQAFVWWRTSSVVDVLAETAGAVVGTVMWRVLHVRSDSAVDAARSLWRRSGAIERALFLYCIAFAALWLFPFDFTLRRIEILDKYQHQRLLMPFTPSPDAASPAMLAATLVMAMPLGAAAALCGAMPTKYRRRSAVSSSCIATLGLTALEVTQVLVFSRTTDGTELVAAGAGALVGTAATTIAGRSSPVAVHANPPEREAR